MKRTFSILLALILCLSLCACRQQEETPPAVDAPPVETPPAETPPSQEPVAPPEEAPVPADPLPGEQMPPEVILGSATTIFKDADETPLVQVDATLPACEGLPQIDSYYKAMYDDLTATCGLNREDAARQQAEYQATGQEFTPWAVDMTAEVTRNDGMTLSVVRTLTEDWPDHQTEQYYAETFDIATQGRLLLGDLFTVGAEVYSPRLLSEGEADQLNFALTGDSLILCTDTGTVTLPLSGLTDILQPQWATE